jgi:hypothetical protein
MDKVDRVKQQIEDLKKGMDREKQKEQILRAKLSFLLKDTEEYLSLEKEIELVKGNQGMISAVLEQSELRLKQLLNS